MSYYYYMHDLKLLIICIYKWENYLQTKISVISMVKEVHKIGVY